MICLFSIQDLSGCLILITITERSPIDGELLLLRKTKALGKLSYMVVMAHLEMVRTYFMLVAMKRQVFDSLDNSTLGWKCIEPVALQIRGQNPSMKLQAYESLNNGQQALLMFRVLYDHAGNTTAEFYGWVSYMLAEPDTWSRLKTGLQYFKDEAMLQLLEEAETFLQKRADM